MRVRVITFAVLCLLAVPAFSQTEATIDSVTGKVEVRPEAGSWQAASEGQRVAPGATISTGFDARATLRIGGAQLRVEPLTRLTVTELVREADTVSTRLFMAAGEVEAEVESAEGLSNDFRIRSTEATAAVRGTSFVFDGRELRVAEGRVAMQNRGGLTRFVVQTQQSSTSGTSPPEDPESATEDAFDVATDTRPADPGSGTDRQEPAPERPGETEPVFIRIEQ